MFKIAICDDDHNICSLIENIILKYRRETVLNIQIEVFFSGEKLCDHIIKNSQFDLIFLDIEMMLLNGIQVGKRIREEMDDYITKIVYVSGKEDYYIELFDVQPMKFIPKPIDEKKIIDAVSLGIKLSKNIDELFSYKKGTEIYKIPLKKILYFESVNREIKIVSTTDDMFYGRIQDITAELFQFSFVQIHKSYVINYFHAIKFKYDCVQMSNSDILPISQSRRKEIRELQLKFEKERLY